MAAGGDADRDLDGSSYCCPPLGEGVFGRVLLSARVGLSSRREKHIRFMFLGGLLAACFVVAPASAMTHREYVAFKHCEQGIVKSCIHRAAIHRGVSYDYMLGISYRESRWNPSAKNPQSTASGLFQFLTSTWANTPYAGRPIFSAKWNALAAGWAMQRGYYSWWAATS